jgi:transcriptional regulator with XRE-family HTH domain
MKTMTLKELDGMLAQDPEYLAAERELRADLDLADDVITLRVEAGWSQAELAAHVGTNQANISRLESALANPTLRFLKKVADALGAELDVRLRRADDMPGKETMEGVLRELEPKVGTVSTNAATDERRLDWQVPAVPYVVDVVVSAHSSRSC